jgi:hypothetical protein
MSHGRLLIKLAFQRCACDSATRSPLDNEAAITGLQIRLGSALLTYAFYWHLNNNMGVTHYLGCLIFCA